MAAIRGGRFVLAVTVLVGATLSCSAVLGIGDLPLPAEAGAPPDASSNDGSTPPADAGSDSRTDAPVDAGCNFQPVTVAGNDWAGWRMPHNASGLVTLAESNLTVQGSTVKDNVTGLLWEKTPLAGTHAYDVAAQHCAQLALPSDAGAWRVPTRIELLSIQYWVVGGDGNQVQPCFRTTHFDKAVEPNDIGYWSSTSVPDAGAERWLVLQSICGAARFGGATSAIRCVAGPIATPRFEVSESCGIVRDLNTRLEWQRYRSADDRGFVSVSEKDARGHCSALRRGLPPDDTGWDLPTMQELYTIVDTTKTNPTFDKNLFPDAPPSTRLPSLSIYFQLRAAVSTASGEQDQVLADEKVPVICVRRK